MIQHSFKRCHIGPSASFDKTLPCQKTKTLNAILANRHVIHRLSWHYFLNPAWGFISCFSLTNSLPLYSNWTKTVILASMTMSHDKDIQN